MGSTVLNPSTTECVGLDIEVMAPSLPPNMRPGAPIMYPSTEKIQALAAEISTVAATVVSSLQYSSCTVWPKIFKVFANFTTCSRWRNFCPVKIFSYMVYYGGPTLLLFVLYMSMHQHLQQQNGQIYEFLPENYGEQNSNVSAAVCVQEKFPPHMVKDLQKVVEQDPLAQLDEQDKELVWKMRYVQHLIRVQTCTPLCSSVPSQECMSTAVPSVST